MKYVFVVLLALFLTGPTSAGASAEADRACPVSVPSDRLLGAPFPKSDRWYGSEALAVQLPYPGFWPMTREGHLIAVKLFWWTAAFHNGKPSDLKVTVENLDGRTNDVVISRATTAYATDLGGWTFLTGVDFPSAGCWEITGEYLGQALTFVVQTVDVDEYLRLVEKRRRE